MIQHNSKDICSGQVLFVINTCYYKHKILYEDSTLTTICKCNVLQQLCFAWKQFEMGKANELVPWIVLSVQTHICPRVQHDDTL